MTTRLCSPAEFILGIQTFIVPRGSRTAILYGTIHGTLLLDGKVALSCHHRITPVNPTEIETGLQTVAQEAADRLKQTQGGKDKGGVLHLDAALCLRNGIPSSEVRFWELPANTAFEEYHLDFFLRSFYKCFGLGIMENAIMRAA